MVQSMDELTQRIACLITGRRCTFECNVDVDDDDDTELQQYLHHLPPGFR
jgi:hypothetical protein